MTPSPRSLVASPARRRGAGYVALALAAGLCSGVAASACSGGASSAAHVATVSGPQLRDTAITHDPCDATSKSAKKVDVNGDGKPDITHVMEGEREVCRIVDLNFDGAPDAFIYYDEKGRERRRESDFDRDGRPDEIDHDESGVIVRKDRETNFDNKLDTWDFFEGGSLVRRERDSDGDGTIDQWWTFNNPQNPKCAIVTIDHNGDGKPDPDSAVDLCADAKAKPAAVASSTPSASTAKPAASASSAAPAASAAPTGTVSPASKSE